MRSAFILFFAILIVTSSEAQNPIWTNGTAMTIPYKRMEISVFRPARYGVGKHTELSAHPIGFFALPHLFVKHEWFAFKYRRKKYLFSTRHGIYYPTLAETLYTRFNFFNVYPEGASFEQALGIQNEILISRWLQAPSSCSPGNNLITLKIGNKYGLGFEKPYSPAALRPIIFRESRVFEPRLVAYIGLGIDAYLSPMFNYFADLDFYSIGKFEDFTVEGKLGIMGYMESNWSAFAGLKGGFTSMNGANKLYIFPIADVAYTFKTSKKHSGEMGLFGDDVFKHQNLDEKGDENIRYRYEAPEEDEGGEHATDTDSKERRKIFKRKK